MQVGSFVLAVRPISPGSFEYCVRPRESNSRSSTTSGCDATACNEPMSSVRSFLSMCRCRLFTSVSLMNAAFVIVCRVSRSPCALSTNARTTAPPMAVAMTITAVILTLSRSHQRSCESGMLRKPALLARALPRDTSTNCSKCWEILRVRDNRPVEPTIFRQRPAKRAGLLAIEADANARDYAFHRLTGFGHGGRERDVIIFSLCEHTEDRRPLRSLGGTRGRNRRGRRPRDAGAHARQERSRGGSRRGARQTGSRSRAARARRQRQGTARARQDRL